MMSEKPSFVAQILECHS